MVAFLGGGAAESLINVTTMNPSVKHFVDLTARVRVVSSHIFFFFLKDGSGVGLLRFVAPPLRGRRLRR